MTLKEKFNELLERYDRRTDKRFGQPEVVPPDSQIWNKACRTEECLDQPQEEQLEHYASLLLSLRDRGCRVQRDFMGGSLLVSYRLPNHRDLYTRLLQEFGRDREAEGEFISTQKIEAWAKARGFPSEQAWAKWKEAFDAAFNERLKALNASAPYGDLFTTILNTVNDAVVTGWVRSLLNNMSLALEGKEYEIKESHLFQQPGEPPFAYSDSDLARGYTVVDGRIRRIDRKKLSAGGIEYGQDKGRSEYDFSLLPAKYDLVYLKWKEAVKQYRRNKTLPHWKRVVEAAMNLSDELIPSAGLDALLNRLDESQPPPEGYSDTDGNGKTTWHHAASIALEHASQLCCIPPYARSIGTLREQLRQKGSRRGNRSLRG